ncbi:MAG: hypothetical protein IPI41_17270 [Flavobacteriales bacterium]|nr:hypothetical protein [Flavobacteriales bacterium]
MDRKLALMSPRVPGFNTSWKAVSTESTLTSMVSALRFSGSICWPSASVRPGVTSPVMVSPGSASSALIAQPELRPLVQQVALDADARVARQLQVVLVQLEGDHDRAPGPGSSWVPTTEPTLNPFSNSGEVSAMPVMSV